MTRPPLEVADIVRAQGNRFIRSSCRWIHWSHRKVLLAIARCALRGLHRAAEWKPSPLSTLSGAFLV